MIINGLYHSIHTVLGVSHTFLGNTHTDLGNTHTKMGVYSHRFGSIHTFLGLFTQIWEKGFNIALVCRYVRCKHAVFTHI